MKTFIQCAVVGIALCAATTSAHGQSADEGPQSDNGSVTITVSSEGLGKYTEELSTTVLRLERLLEEIKKAELSLPREDIEKLDQLVASSTRLIETVGQNAEQIATVIQDAEAPVLDLSTKLLDQAEQRVVVPVLDGVDSAVAKASKTLTHAVIALWILVLLILVFVCVAAYVLNQRVRSLFTGAGKIIEGHVIVPRDTWEMATAALNSNKRVAPPYR